MKHVRVLRRITPLVHAGHATSTVEGNADGMPAHPSKVHRLFDVQGATNMLMAIIDVQGSPALQVLPHISGCQLVRSCTLHTITTLPVEN